MHDIEYIKIINDKIDEVKRQYALPVYDIENIPDQQIQFTINGQLFLETLLIELRGKSISYSSYNKKNYDMILSCYKLWACYHLYMMPLLFTEGTSENRKSCLLELYYMYI